MEFKVIVYIIIAVFYFVYSAAKKAQEQKPKSSAKPIQPPVENPLEEIMRQIQQRKTEAVAKTTVTQPKPSQTYQPKKAKEVLIHQKQKDVFAEGNYVRELTEEEKTERGKLKIANEGIYKIKSADEMQEESQAYELDVRQAIIGSVILERKF